jgi:hypothetical protein
MRLLERCVLLGAIAFFVVCLVVYGRGQEIFAQMTEPVVKPEKFPAEPTIKPVTAEEEIGILAEEKELASATAEQQEGQRRVNESRDRLNKLGQAVLDSRHLTKEVAALCDGPSQGPCADVKPNRIALRPIPKAKVETKK